MSETYYDQIPPETGRKYSITANPDGTSSITDVTTYIQDGTPWGADDANQTMRKEDYDPDGDGILGTKVTLTGYAKPATPSALAPTDTVNVAAGKLEKGLETKADLSGGKVSPVQASAAIVSVTADKTLGLSDAGTLQKCAGASANITVTVPANAAVPLPVGTEIELVEYSGAYTTTLAADTGVTINSADGALTIDGQYGAVCLKKLGVDEWLLAGALS